MNYSSKRSTGKESKDTTGHWRTKGLSLTDLVHEELNLVNNDMGELGSRYSPNEPSGETNPILARDPEWRTQLSQAQGNY